jgi:hypothetical protein
VILCPRKGSIFSPLSSDLKLRIGHLLVAISESVGANPRMSELADQADNTRVLWADALSVPVALGLAPSSADAGEEASGGKIGSIGVRNAVLGGLRSDGTQGIEGLM